ncbi:MAG: hypothetical protein KIT10_05480 [Flavobacteriales bacterium]|nr:hypothetical protein [Flavobacteriales bacterium]
MRTPLTFVAIITLAWLLGLFLPFWSLSIAAAAVGFLVHPGGWRSLLAGLLAGALLWGGLAWHIDSANASILATRIGQFFGTGATGMVLITAALGALLAGLGALLGDRVRNAFS